MTATEANGTDPQQRIMLEVAYEALENGELCTIGLPLEAKKYFLAGIPIHTLVGSQTSVYVGCFTSDYESIGGRDPCKIQSSAR